MKKLILALIMVGLMFGSAEAFKTERCYWIWDTAVTGANAAPNDVYCDSTWNNNFTSKGASHIQNTAGAFSSFVQYDTVTPDGVNTIGGLHTDITDTQVICSNTSEDSDLNVLGCTGGVCDIGTGTSAYYQKNGIVDAIVDSFELTPPTGGFKLTLDENASNNGCLVVRTTVIW